MYTGGSAPSKHLPGASVSLKPSPCGNPRWQSYPEYGPFLKIYCIPVDQNVVTGKPSLDYEVFAEHFSLSSVTVTNADQTVMCSAQGQRQWGPDNWFCGRISTMVPAVYSSAASSQLCNDLVYSTSF